MTQVSVFKHLEVNVFPSVPYNLDINIRRDEAAALTQYFKLEVRNFGGSSLHVNHHNETLARTQNIARLHAGFDQQSRQKRMSQGQRGGGFFRQGKARPGRPATTSAPPGAAASGGMGFSTHPTRLAMRLAMALTPARLPYWNIKGRRRTALLEGALPGLHRRTRRGEYRGSRQP